MIEKKLRKEDLVKMQPDELAALVLNLTSIVQTQNEEIAELKELVKLKTAERYCPSSEQMGWLFQELEILDSVLSSQPEPDQTTEVAAHSRKVRERVNACSAPADAPVCDVFHTEGAADTLVGKDGIVLTRVEDKIIDKLAMIPRKMVVERHHYPQYKALDVDAGKDGKRVLLPAKTSALGASPSLVAGVVVSKFDDHLPLYRQEEIFRREGYFLSRQKLASWVITYYEQLLPFMGYFKKRVYRSAFLSKDETNVSVLDVRGPTGKVSKSGFMYITIGDSYDEQTRKTHSLVLLDYIQGRSREVLFEDIGKYNYTSHLMTDGLKGYLSYDKHCVCWVHAVRQLKKILKINKHDVNALRIVKEVAKLYDIDEQYRKKLHSGELSADQFLAARKQESGQVIDSVYAMADETRRQYAPKGAMGKALDYLDTYKPYMRTYLDVVEATPSNNACELVAKAFATGRKNWLFSQSVDGADASAFFYSMIETAKRQALNPLDYVEALCTFGPGCSTDEQWEALLPWKIDLSRLDEVRKRRLAAKADPGRTSPYSFVGATR
ncbi:MAG: IS66 family transposase [Sphaerochaeta sp.]|jgi:transposase|uniref:IS66 family transposase n=1 Tax=Sphaerochaeta sp. TaxID=1972642 RepID=UPI00297BC262|nr:IS66 family transposase [Sphaerochaeta sp.]MDD3058343.1 IS66 family transposase [Sphaerochaeta sp.]MDD3930393.1 IS66 family transposase [Sphaerochaeta sp.]MDX9985724.1 IS66 family transposase [Sphaerochaeta sp.]